MNDTFSQKMSIVDHSDKHDRKKENDIDKFRKYRLEPLFFTTI